MIDKKTETETRCGFIAIVGRPNVGKSTLMNHILGKKLSITSRRPQTTQQQIWGVKTTPNYQLIFIDTPGLHDKKKHSLDKHIHEAAVRAFGLVDVIVFLVEPNRWQDADQWVFELAKKSGLPLLVVMNKVDCLANLSEALPAMAALTKKLGEVEIVPISALKEIQIDVLEKRLAELLPVSPFCYPEGQITDRTDEFLAAEMIREKIFRMLGQELPYQMAVTIDKLETKKDLIKIYAVIWVGKPSQKPILIGKQGQQLKKIGTQAREDMERAFEKKVYLQLWVKVKKDWASDEALLQKVGMTRYKEK
jgi:GTP-binding protein Era